MSAIDAHRVGPKHPSCSNLSSESPEKVVTPVSSETAMLTRRYGGFRLCLGVALDLKK